MERFPASLFFDLSVFPFPDLFREEEPVWETIRRLPQFVDSLFQDGRIRPLSPERLNSYYHDHVLIEGRVSIGEGTEIHPFAVIKGDVVIGRNCRIWQFTLLRGPLILADGSEIGHHSAVFHSVLFPGARAAHQNLVQHSLIGANVNLGGGARTADWKLDGSPIKVGSVVRQSGVKMYRKVSTGLNKLGATVGDGSSIGGGAGLNPGALLGKRSRVGMGVVVPNDFFPEGIVLKR